MIVKSTEKNLDVNEYRFGIVTCNRSGLVCLVIVACIIVGGVFAWFLLPDSVFLRYELNHGLGRQASDTVRRMGPEAIPILVEGMSVEKSGYRLPAITASSQYISLHPRESGELISALCRNAFPVKNNTISIYALNALRGVETPSDVIDRTVLELIKNHDARIRIAAEELLLARIAVSKSVCHAREQLTQTLENQDAIEIYETKLIKQILAKCDRDKIN